MSAKSWLGLLPAWLHKSFAQLGNLFFIGNLVCFLGLPNQQKSRPLGFRSQLCKGF
jgi:hypothetical protein